MSIVFNPWKIERFRVYCRVSLIHQKWNHIGLPSGISEMEFSDAGLEWKCDNQYRTGINHEYGCLEEGLGWSSGVTEISGKQKSWISTLLFWNWKEVSLHCGPFQRTKGECYVHLQIENQTAVPFIQKMEATQRCCQSPGHFAILLNWEIFLSANYLPGSQNSEANWQELSRQQRLEPEAICFQAFSQNLGPNVLWIHLRAATIHNSQGMSFGNQTLSSGDRCIPTVLKGGGSLPVSSICNDLDVWNLTEESNSHSDRPALADKFLISDATVHFNLTKICWQHRVRFIQSETFQSASRPSTVPN